MGQRLNVEIKKGDKLLANAYYHWDAYSGVAIERCMDILEYMDEYPQENTDDVLYAIRLLEHTGAGLTDFNPTEEDKALYKQLYTPEYYKKWVNRSSEIKTAQKSFPNCEFKECNGRNDGLISITENGMEETERWEEGRVTIYIDTNTVDFGVYWDYTIEEYKEDYERPPIIKKVDFNLDNMTLEQVYQFHDIIIDYQEGVYDLLELPDGSHIQFIY